MPQLVRLYIVQSAIGFAISAVFTGLILYFNVANLWHLVTHTSAGPLAVFLFWLFNGIVFSSVQFGISVMRMADKPDGDGGRRDPVEAEPAFLPVPVKADARR